ncbi:zinc finger protein 235-like isoform X1 [Adelges cooleyi]|uniref:zinc finger protein 235-like isoform X1 n=2 Tax=Adelges cooleyi TaxID=133065 RepID=UPI0021805612|nr:zinc finger protein 235-like isoform X1 [Adelges cooleyi]
MSIIPDRVPSSKSKNSVNEHRANESANDRSSQLSFSSVDEVKNKLIVKNEIVVTDDGCYKPALKIEEENDPLNAKLTDINETWKEMELKYETNETDDCNYETKVKLEREDTQFCDNFEEDIKPNYFIESYYNNRSTAQNEPQNRIDEHTYSVSEVDILNGCKFESVVEVDRNLPLLPEWTGQLQSLACNTCQKSFSSKRRIVHHIQEAHNLNSTVRNGPRKKIVKNHNGEMAATGIVISIKKESNGWCVNTKKESGLHECDVCVKTFSCKAELVIHERVHTEGKPYRCNVCKKTYSCSGALKAHKFLHTGEKPFECVVCEKRFNRKDHLAAHERSHTGEKPFKCYSCEKTFTLKATLKKHEMYLCEAQPVRTGEKQYWCRVCKRMFSCSASLKEHKAVHASQRPYKCSLCPHSCITKCDLRNHERVHTGEKPFECVVCGKCFSRNGNLIAHERLHAGEKPFKCYVCGQLFAKKETLKRHERVHTGERPYKCRKCRQTFTRKYILESHQAEAHD